MKLIETLLFLKVMFFINVAFSNQNTLNIEEQFRDLSSELRCLVCQNQSLLDSDSDLAKDLKRIIYEKLKAGNSNYEIKEYLVKRYGEFILFKPLLNISNLLLWLTPLLSILVIGFIGFRKTKFKQKK